MSSHTGTWRAFESVFSKGEWGVETDDPAMVEAGDEIIVYPSLSEPLARLIASAPNLLAALLAENEADEAFDAADEYTHRAEAEGWLNDPTGSMHVTEAWDRANKLRAQAKELRRSAISKASEQRP